MFTGIIEEIGTVKYILKKGNSAEISINCFKVLEDAMIGDSIAVDGVCLTVKNFDKSSFSADISYETLNKTTLSRLVPDDKVNLERALTLQTRLGGHIVLGHVDCVGIIKQIRNIGNSIELYISDFNPIKQYIANKGSIALNGISLTVAEIKENIFTVAIIPHTFEMTNLKYKQVGDRVNLEADIVARYLERLLQNKDNNSKLIDMLRNIEL
ncbi:MAG: riboflavin synthase [Calditerrivibrio sp.]|nr:riboflavin synthase [Calditerrivibrio sp.]